MHLTTLEEYGVRCALQLARHRAEEGAHPVRAPEIAEMEGLSHDYASKIMQIFKKNGIVLSIRGHQGGFSLKNAASDITLKMILDCLKSESYQTNNFCDLYTGLRSECVHKCDCSLRPVWTMLFYYFDEFLSSITLEDLITNESSSYQFVQSIALKQSQKSIQKIKSK